MLFDVDRTDRDHRRVVARRADRAEHFPAVGRLAELPAATTTVMPAALALRTAMHSGSLSQLCVDCAAKLRFITRMLYSFAW